MRGEVLLGSYLGRKMDRPRGILPRGGLVDYHRALRAANNTELVSFVLPCCQGCLCSCARKSRILRFSGLYGACSYMSLVMIRRISPKCEGARKPVERRSELRI